MESYLARFTYHDVVGHLLPGSIVLFAIVLVLSGISASPVGDGFPVAVPEGAAEWGAALVAAYFLGHGAQFASSRRYKRSEALRRVAESTDRELLRWSREVLKLRGFDPTLGPEGIDALPESEVIRRIDSLKLPSADQEVFISRQSFHRGSAFAFLLLFWAALAVLVTALAIVVGLSVSSGFLGEAAVMNLIQIAVIAALAGLMWRACWHRYFDFVKHEIEFGLAAERERRSVAAQAAISRAELR